MRIEIRFTWRGLAKRAWLFYLGWSFGQLAVEAIGVDAARSWFFVLGIVLVFWTVGRYIVELDKQIDDRV